MIVNVDDHAVSLLWRDHQPYTGRPAITMAMPIRLSRGDADIWIATITTDATTNVTGTSGYPTIAVRRPVVRPAAQPHQARRHQREEDPLRVDHAREQRAVGVGERERRRPDRLQHDRAMRRAEHRMDRRHGLEQQAVARHRVVHARADEDDPVHRAERRDHHERRHDRGAAASEQRVGRFGRDTRRAAHGSSGRTRR